MENGTRYGRNAGFVHREVGGEEILVPVRRAGGDLSSIYLLSPVGSTIWRCLARSRTSVEIVAAIVEEFEVDPEIAASDLGVFLGELEAVDAVRREGEA